MIFLCTDGEPAMSGGLNGLKAHFERESKYRISLICLNHKENTGIKDIYT